MIREFRLNGWRVQPQFHQLVGPGGSVDVEAHSMEVLVALARQAGEVVSRQDLLEEVWGESIVEEAALTHAIWDLRRALGDDPKKPEYIQTLPKRGYRLIAKVAWLDRGVGETERYRLLRRIGAGGMGVVFEAEDTRLRRHVALKFLPPELSRDPLAKDRFLREGRVAAALDHPNLCTLHEIDETDDGRLFLVMALCDGETLKARLARGRLKTPEALETAGQITQGLAALHSAGIIHRDIKPGNVMVPESGPARILDFGLAKFASGTQLTKTSTSPGTPAYMSPEQVRGEVVDVRTDVWSLGVVIHEMLAGRPPFGRGDQSAVMFAILENEVPRIAESDDATRNGLCTVSRRALSKSPNGRYANASELAQALYSLGYPAAGEPVTSPHSIAEDETDRLERTVEPVPPPGPNGDGRHIRPLTIVVALGGLLAALGLWAFWPSRDSTVVPFVPGSSRQVTELPGWEADAAISPDGQMIAYASDQSGNSDIWLIDAGGGRAIQLTESTSTEREPAWFPDGKTLVYSSVHEGRSVIRKVPRLGGSHVTLIEDGSDPAISPDGSRVAFAKTVPGGLTQIAVAYVDQPGSEEVLTGQDGWLWGQTDPAWSPDGTQLCFSDASDLWVVPADGGEARRLTTDAAGDMEPAWSPDGRFVYFSSYRESTLALWRVPSTGGTSQRITPGTGPERHPSFSQDGDRLAYTTFLDDPDIMLVDLRTGDQQRLPGTRSEWGPELVPRGDALIYISDRWKGYSLWRQALDGLRPEGEPIRLNDEPATSSNPAVSPDGEWVAYQRREGTGRAIWIMPAVGGTPTRISGPEPSFDYHPSWSPRGDRLAFVSRRNGVSTLWVVEIQRGQAGGEPMRVEAGVTTLTQPEWSPDGLNLAYLSGDGGTWDLWITTLAGTLPPRKVTSGVDAYYARWLPPGDRILLTGLWEGNRISLRRVDITTGLAALVTPAVDFGSSVISGEFSLDASGALLAFTYERPRGDVWLLQQVSPGV